MPEDVSIADALQDVRAPAKGAPTMSRGPLRPPDWRYQTAASYLADQRAGRTPCVPEDPLVQYAVRALRAFGYDRGAMCGSRRFLADCMDDMYAAMYFGVTAKDSAMSAGMDACLIKGLKYGPAVQRTCGVTHGTYDLYAGIFFDLSGVRAVHSWMQDFLFSPERYRKNTGLLRARLLAYYGDTDAGLGVTVTGMLKDSESDVIKEITRNERQKRIFDYMAREVSMEPDTYVAVMEAAARSMTDHDFQEHMKDREDAGSLKDLAVRMEEGIRAFSERDSAMLDATGNDFTNRYTTILTGTGNG